MRVQITKGWGRCKGRLRAQLVITDLDSGRTVRYPTRKQGRYFELWDALHFRRGPTAHERALREVGLR